MITKANAKKYDDALADVLFWMRGLEDAATLMDKHINGVPTLDTLRKLRDELGAICDGAAA